MVNNAIILRRGFIQQRLPKLISYGFKTRLFSRYGLRCGFSTKPQCQPQKWCSVVGLEIHAQILSKSKMFSDSATLYGAPTNTQVSYFDAALPGTLPVLNKRCVEAGVITALALDCKINQISTFDRKHYFYADMPAGFQITQYRKPLAVSGKLEYVVPGMTKKMESTKKVAHITQIQLEVDSGKSLHDYEDKQSLIDLNRAGMGLMEIVTDPDFTNGEDASAFLKELQLILMTLATCDGKMSEGSFRVDANISVHRSGEPYGVRTEVKNINSLRNVSKAINFEIKRQIEELESGNEIQNETRSFNPETGKTVTMRDKEGFQDYRFMPEPNLPPVFVYDNQSLPEKDNDAVNMDAIQSKMPELPNQQRTRLQQDYNLSLDTINILLFEPGLMKLFEEILANIRNDSLVKVQNIANLLMNDFLSVLHSKDLSVETSNIQASDLGDICIMIAKDEISKTTAKNVVTELFDHPHESAKNIVQSKNWYQIKDVDQLKVLCKDAISQYPSAVKKFKKGKKKAINPLIVHVLDATDGCAEPRIVTDILKKMLT